MQFANQSILTFGFTDFVALKAVPDSGVNVTEILTDGEPLLGGHRWSRSRVGGPGHCPWCSKEAAVFRPTKGQKV